MSTVELKQTEIELRPDPSRVIARLFVPGREDVGPGDSRAKPVIERILGVDEREVERAVGALDPRFSNRHRDLHEVFRTNAATVWPRIDPTVHMSEARQLFLGACFTHEYAIEGAALCNPSAVLHPNQTGDDTAFVMSVRCVGEGHISSIGFRTGTVTVDGKVTIDAPGALPQTANATPGRHHRSVFHERLAELGDESENAAFVLDGLPDLFDDTDLDKRIDALTADIATRRRTAATIANLRDLARSSYEVTFPDITALSERVLWPQTPVERHGMEDARFVRFVEDSGDVAWYATYTAFDGTSIAQHLLRTTDFATFAATPMAGAAASAKGLALFPRKIGGKYAALSRVDRETNSITYSDDLRVWNAATTIQVPERAWEILQIGNCGSPIETADGWLVLTHGVGPMRTYSLAAILLDLDDPQHVIARSDEPIMAPDAGHRDGYVPNVLYSCGGFSVGDLLVLPYGVADQKISVATLSIRQLIDSLHRTS